MKAVFNWNDMKQFGIDFLTGEPCGFNIRGLCDLNKRGRKLVADFFGLDPQMFAEHWNNDGEVCVMLSYSVLRDLAVFCMLMSGCKLVVTFVGQAGVYGAETQDEVEQYTRIMQDENQYPKVEECFRAKGDAVGGSRCTHAMTGRAV